VQKQLYESKSSGIFRYSLHDTVARTLALVLLLIGSFLLLDAVVWSAHSFLGISLIVSGLVITIFLYYKHIVLSFDPRKRQYFPITVVEMMSFLEIIDSKGLAAKYSRHQICIVEEKRIAGYTESRLFADGQIRDIKTGEDTVSQTRVLPDGSISVDVIFQQPPVKGQVFQRSLSCLYIDSFKNDEEFFVMRFIHPCRRFSFFINFPPDRPAKEAWLDIENEGRIMKKVTNRDFIETEVDNKTGIKKIRCFFYDANVGSKLTVRWIW
jgi:hypothetical protein